MIVDCMSELAGVVRIVRLFFWIIFIVSLLYRAALFDLIRYHCGE